MIRKLVRHNIECMAGYVPGEQPAPVPGIVKLNTNENPYPPSPRVAEALASFDPARLRMYPDPVSLRLRQTIAAVHGCAIGNVFACNGSDEVLALCTRAFVEDDGSIGFHNPSYSLYPVLADIRGVAKKPVELAADFGWSMPENYACSVFFLTYPNAPTGVRYAKSLVRACAERLPGVLVVDEAYVDFADENCMDMALQLDNVLVVRTLSKSYSLAGLRVGYAVGCARLVEALFKVKDSYNLDALSQELAIAALKDQDYMRGSCRKVRATRQRLVAALAKRGYTVFPSETNFVFARPSGITADELFRKLRARNVFIRYFAGPRTGDCIRITVGTDEQVDALLAALAEVS